MNDRPSPLKIAIPKQRRPWNDRRPRVPRSRLPRVQRACNNCRLRKVKCKGDQPHCQNCLDLSVQCIYPLARKDRLKEANERVSRLVTLVNDLSEHVDDFGQHRIEEVLASISAIDSAPSGPSTTEETEVAERPWSAEERADPTAATDMSWFFDLSDDLGLGDDCVPQDCAFGQSGVEDIQL